MRSCPEDDCSMQPVVASGEQAHRRDYGVAAACEARLEVFSIALGR